MVDGSALMDNYVWHAPYALADSPLVRWSTEAQMDVPEITLREDVASFEVNGVRLMTHLAGARRSETLTNARKEKLQECVASF
jgi:hypothetical protein